MSHNITLMLTTYHFAYDKLMNSCDVKAMIYHFVDLVVTSKLLYIVSRTWLGNSALSYVHRKGILYKNLDAELVLHEIQTKIAAKIRTLIQVASENKQESSVL